MHLSREVLQSGIFSGFSATPSGHLGGVMVRRLEYAFCDYFNVKYAVSMNSGTACLHSALIACGIGSGDEVIVPAMSFSSSASCVLMARAKPLFADIDEDTFNLDVGTVEPTIKMKAIIPVHLHGLVADMDDIMSAVRGIKVIEDCAQAIGAKYNNKYAGTIGDCGIFSFNQNKPLFCGSGGMLVTNNEEIAQRARLVRNHGETQSDILGYNYRMGEIEAALILEQLPQLESRNSQRIELANYFTEQLLGVVGITPPDTTSGNVFFRYAMKYNQNRMHRNEFQERLIKRSVFFGNKNYGKPLYLQPIYKEFNQKPCPVAERLWRDELMVLDWLKPPTTKGDINGKIEIIKEVIDVR